MGTEMKLLQRCVHARAGACITASSPISSSIREPSTCRNWKPQCGWLDGWQVRVPTRCQRERRSWSRTATALRAPKERKLREVHATLMILNVIARKSQEIASLSSSLGRPSTPREETTESEGGACATGRVETVISLADAINLAHIKKKWRERGKRDKGKGGREREGGRERQRA
eukprot:241564-Pleurochrysis_carterae.AAC.1